MNTPKSPNDDSMPARRPDVTLEQVQAFCAVAEAGSYRRAAYDLRPDLDSHVWLIRRLKRLEKTVGKTLVENTARGDVRLTSIGHQLLPAARIMRDAGESLKKADPAIRLSAYPSIAASLLEDESARELFEGEPALALYDVAEHHRGDRGRGLLNRTALGEIDLVIGPSGSGRTELAIELVERKLYEWTLQVVLPQGWERDLRAPRRVRARDLTAIRIVCTPVGHRSRELIARAFEDDGLTLVPYAEHSSQEVLFRLAQKVPHVAAILPSDALGHPKELGPNLASKKEVRYGDSYSLYHRRPYHSGSLSQREKQVAEFAEKIVAVFRPGPAKLARELQLQTRRVKKP